MSPDTKEGVEEGWCLGLGQASFVFFNKGIKRTSNLIRERKFQDIVKGLAPEARRGSKFLLTSPQTDVGSRAGSLRQC